MPTVTLTVENGLGILRLSRERGNAINPELVRDLTAASAEARDRTDVRGILLAAAGKLFSPGLDLVELLECDRERMEGFLHPFTDMVLQLYAMPKPVVAALHGHAVAGGCVLALTADWRVLRRGAVIGLNEVKVGVPLPFGVAMMLRESVTPRRLEEIALLGKNYTDAEAVEAGLAHELHDAEGFEAFCLERLAAFAEKDARAFAMTKGFLREATIERIRAHERDRASDFLDCWFSPGTQARIRAIVADLKQRG